MHPLVPGFIQERYLAAETGGEFPAVGLFLDLSGFSSMTSALMAHGQHGAEVLAQVIRAVFDPLIDAVFAQGGFVASSAGDSLTILFSGQPGDSSCARRAISAAWEIQRHLGQHAAFPTEYQDFRITARVGLADGIVRWGIITGQEAGRGVYYFQGPPIDSAALAEQQAQAGQIVLSAALAERLGDWVRTAPAEQDFTRLLQVHGALMPPQPLPPPAAERRALRQFFPDVLLDQPISGELRQVVSMMVNLPTISTETQLRIFMRSVFSLQQIYGGLINRLDFGDKGTNLVIFWGAPTAYENDVQRALNFILELQSSTSIPIAAGVTYRIAHAGFIGGTRHEDYTCSGQGTNLAARLMTAAPRGEILICEQVAQRAGRDFEIEYSGERTFKGFPQPQKVYTLLERKEPEAQFYQGSLAGRAEEQAALRAFLQPALAGQFAGLLAVSGEAGIGKSRLVYAVLQDLHDQRADLQVCLGQTDDLLRAPFNPFTYWLRSYFNIHAALGDARNKRSFNRKLDELIAATADQPLADELDRTRSFLGALVGLDWADSLYEQLDAQGRYSNTFLALAALLQAESRRAPLVLLLEDIHLLDDDSRAFLPSLLRALADCPAAVLCTSRDPLPALGLEIPSAQSLTLDGLDRAGLRALAEARLGGPPAASLLDLLAERAEGNPFYAEQILLYIKEQNLLQPGEQGWTYQRRPGSALPAQVSTLLLARLDHLLRAVQEAVQHAAVLGREFDTRLLEVMLRGAPGVELPEVTSAEQEGIWARLSENRYLFKHMLMREVAYQMQVRTRLQALHARALAAYERIYAADLDPYYPELAYHAEQAALPAPALRYLRLSGQAAAAAYLNTQAVDYFTRALAFTDPEDLPARCDLLLQRHKVYETLGRQAEVEQDLEALEALVPALGDRQTEIEVLLRRAMFLLDAARHPESDAAARQALALAQPAGLPDLASRAYFILATNQMRRGRLPEAEAEVRAGLRLAQQAKARLEQLQCQNMLGLIAREQGQPQAAQAAFAGCLELARQLNRPDLQIAPLNNIAMIRAQTGDYVTALDSYQQAIATARRVGDRTKEAIGLSNLGHISGLMGEYAQAMHYLQQSLQIMRGLGMDYYMAYPLFNVSAFAGALGDYATAEQQARAGLELARAQNDLSGEAWGLTYLGHSLLAQNDLPAAAEVYTAACAIRQQMEQPALAAEPAAGLARAALAQGDLPAARRCIQPVLDLLDGGGSLDAADEPVRVYLTCALVLEQDGDPRARALLETAHDLLHQRAAQIPGEDTRAAFLHDIPHHRETEAAWHRQQ